MRAFVCLLLLGCSSPPAPQKQLTGATPSSGPTVTTEVVAPTETAGSGAPMSDEARRDAREKEKLAY